MGLKFEAFYAKVVAPRLAQMYAECLREVLGVQAPTRVTASGNIVAATRATPGAPPRMVTKRLKESVQVRNGNKIYILAPYAAWLEHRTSHKYVARAKKLLLARSKSSRATIRG